MIIYVSHPKSINFQNNLYQPIKKSLLASRYKFIFPHDKSEKPFSSKSYFINRKCNLVLAEVSAPATGQGIELGWADLSDIPIVCMYRKGVKVSGSLKVICKDFIEYFGKNDLVMKLDKYLQKMEEDK